MFTVIIISPSACRRYHVASIMSSSSCCQLHVVTHVVTHVVIIMSPSSCRHHDHHVVIIICSYHRFAIIMSSASCRQSHVVIIPWKSRIEVEIPTCEVLNKKKLWGNPLKTDQCAQHAPMNGVPGGGGHYGFKEHSGNGEIQNRDLHHTGNDKFTPLHLSVGYYV